MDESLSSAERAQRSEEYADRAVHLLYWVREAGYFKLPGRRARLKTDRELDPPRGRSLFQQLLVKIEI